MIQPEDTFHRAASAIPSPEEDRLLTFPKGLPNLTADQQHGLANGLDQLDQATYEAWVSSEEMARFLEQRANEKTDRLNQLDQQIAAQKALVEQARTASWTHYQSVETLKIRLQQVESQKKKWEKAWENWHQRQNVLTPSASWLMGILYFVAGWVFIVGDLIISHEIVAYALQIRGTFESWAFAVGLALLSILLKPAYDHWIERPFLQDKNTGRYRHFHGIIALFALITLGILGAFRYEAYQVEQQKQSLNRQIRQWQINMEDSTDSSQTLEILQAKMEQLNQLSLSLVDSPKAFASFVLSGLLFALAGAICLGLAIPMLQAFWTQTFQQRPLKKRLEKQRQVLEDQALALALEQTEHQIQWEASQTITLDPALSIERDQLIQEIDSIHEKLIRTRENIRISQYAEGYQRGALARQQLSPEEWGRWRSSWAFPWVNAPKNTKSSYLPDYLST